MALFASFTVFVILVVLVTPHSIASATLAHRQQRPSLRSPQSFSLSLGNEVFEDVNNNGLKEDDEKGVPGIMVRLLDGNRAVVGYAKTDADGRYVFSALIPGQYSVEIVLPQGYESSKDAITSAVPDNTIDNDDNGVLLMGSVVRSNPVTVGAEGAPDANLTLDFGLWRPATLGNHVWRDDNNNGMQDGDADSSEMGLSNIEITLFAADGSPINTATSDANGDYHFDKLLPGEYAIGVKLPDGYAFSPQASEDDAATDSDIDPHTGRTGLVKLAPGENNLALDAGLFPIALQLSIAQTARPKPGTPSNPAVVRPGDLVTYTFVITNIGSTDVTDVVLTDVVPVGTSYVAGSANPPPTTSNTAQVWATPALSASQSMAVRFSVRVDSSTFAQIHNEAGVRSDQTPLVASNVITHDVAPPILPSPAIALVVLPEVQTVTVGSSALFTVQVINNGGFDLTDVEVRHATAQNCDWFVGDLASGQVMSYTCSVANVVESFWSTFTTIGFASRGSSVSASQSAWVQLDGTAQIGDYVWLDADGDGIQRANVGMAGVIVRLTPTDSASTITSTQVITQVTDGQGFYHFKNILQGRYSVCFGLPSGYSFTRPGTNPISGVDSNADPVTGCTAPVTATASTINATIDAGLVPIVMQLEQTAEPRPSAINSEARVNVGDRITYTLHLMNAGSQTALNVVVTDALPIDVKFVAGSASPEPIVNPGALRWLLPQLIAGQGYTLSFGVVVVSKLNTSIENQAYVLSQQTPMTTSNTIVHVLSLTAVQLIGFSGRWLVMEGRAGVELDWQTGVEVDSFGFALYRSVTGQKSDRVLVTPVLISAKNASGASYSFLDATAMPGNRYTYWLAETERSGSVIEYDPATVNTPASMGMALGAVAGGVPVAAPAGSSVVAQPDVTSNAPSAMHSTVVQSVQPVRADVVQPVVETSHASEAAPPTPSPATVKPNPVQPSDAVAVIAATSTSVVSSVQQPKSSAISTQPTAEPQSQTQQRIVRVQGEMSPLITQSSTTTPVTDVQIAPILLLCATMTAALGVSLLALDHLKYTHLSR